MAWTRGVTINKGQGRFYCPSCWGECGYHKRGVFRFFAIADVPLIPLGMVGDYIECEACKATFGERVLEFEPVEGKDDFESEYERAVKRVLVLMMLADGVVDPADFAGNWSPTHIRRRMQK